MSQNLVVAFSPLHSCLVNLPARWVSALSTTTASKGCMVFKISWSNGRSAYVAWSGGMSRAEQRDRTGKISSSVLEIDGTFGSQLGLAEGAEVSVEFIPSVSTCTATEVVPAHFDDWEILELNAGAVEERLLQQARVVAVDQPIVFWLNSSTSVCLHTKTITPKDVVCLLDNDTEVMVAPMVRSHGIPGGASQLLTDSDRAQPPKPKVACLRIAVEPEAELGAVYTNTLSATSAALGAPSGCSNDKQSKRIVRISHVSRRDASLVSGDKQQPTEAGSSVPWLAQLVTSPDVQPGVLLVSPETLKICGGRYAVGELVRAEALTETRVHTASPEGITLSTDQPNVSDEDIRDALLAMLGDRPWLVLNVGSDVVCKGHGQRESKSLARITSFTAPSASAVENKAPITDESSEIPLIISRSALEDIDISCVLESFSLDTEAGESPTTGEDSGSGTLAGIDEFLEDAWQRVDSALMTSSGGGILICGRRGSGKTSILKHLAQHAGTQQRDRLVYWRYVECAKLTIDPRTSKVKEALQAIVEDALTHQPSLLVLDDLDGLFPAENEQSDSKRVRQLVDCITNLLNPQDGRQTTVLATATNRVQLHSGLFTAGIFHDVLEVPAPGKAEREQILSAIAESSVTRADADDVNFSILSYLTEGYMPADLHALYERSVHEATMRVLEHDADAVETQIAVRHEDLVRAHSGFKPLSMRGVQLHSSQTRWSDIGGLEDTRRQLRETLELPTKYAAIFATSPLRLRSGVLLYGHPGCGKTLLASAIARECGLNFISTKGPELLSKYIGSSEQSVRDLFRRAVAAAPCVLFFDEFDSIAPRRGHDNTGVTDRVVNQFLTEMDGAEGLKGVYVLAATSRPDLIDPALLRPGRLDKSFLCGMPDLQDRADILQRQATKLKVSDEVDWKNIASRTENFTGADLQALVYNAFLESVHEMTDKHKAVTAGAGTSDGDDELKHAEFAVAKSSAKPLSAVEKTQMAERLYRLLINSDPTSTHDSSAKKSMDAAELESLTPVVSMAHFEAAFKVTQSSLGEQDRVKFEGIYRDFVDDKKGSGDKPRKPVEQKATMA